MRRANRGRSAWSAPRLPLRHAVALGLLHGPTELLPISSSGHTTLVPWLANWPYAELDPELRKAFEIALHAGTAAALLVRPPREMRARRPWRTCASPPWRMCARRPWSDGEGGAPPRFGTKLGFLAAALVPPALTGYAFGEQIEHRLGTPATIAAGLLAGSGAMLAGEMHASGGYPTHACGADIFATITPPAQDAGTHPAPRAGTRLAARAGTRTVASADWRDGLALGLAQALALMPGVSRNGATLAAARARGFSRPDADRLSWKVGLPVIAGAASLKAARLAREGTPRELRLALATGAASAFLSTLATARGLGAKRRAGLVPACAVYRVALALVVIRRMRDNTYQQPSHPPKK